MPQTQTQTEPGVVRKHLHEMFFNLINRIQIKP